MKIFMAVVIVVQSVLLCMANSETEISEWRHLYFRMVKVSGRWEKVANQCLDMRSPK